ncbi:YicC family protein [Halobacteriovorax sp. GB3]|uniref:YicC/YloC family endoribonuclease n=1 Tax=Halobacteriovorax sp. GB3 TaxID=2719615 RepID=UPI00235F28E6|nr:YicC/YloC family endoribonuclease [Halobacteriovorax sp. GB3]MDD0854852.1 YicC family protein [Halobacteriovorax sp. GB3]
MAIQSMTGFGSGEASNDEYTVTVEIKSVNHRFKDVRFKMSSLFSSIELDLKKMLLNVFKRGSFDIYLSYKRVDTKTRFDDIDETKVEAFLSKAKSMAQASGVELQISATDFLRSEFFKDVDETRNETTLGLAKEAFAAAIEGLKESRLQEGSKMVDVIKKHRQTYEENYKTISGLTETFQNHVEDKLKKRIADMGKELSVDEPRFLQEVVYYMEKLDVHEEINRIDSHLQKLDSLLSSNKEVGRQIDFLVQELNRETNTIGSKSGLQEISEAVVQMKVQLEKIREQGLNLE